MISHTNSNTNKLKFKEHSNITVSDTFIVSLGTRVHLHVQIFQPQDFILIRKIQYSSHHTFLGSFLILFLNLSLFVSGTLYLYCHVFPLKSLLIAVAPVRCQVGPYVIRGGQCAQCGTEKVFFLKYSFSL